jgi:hypothetical protein
VCGPSGRAVVRPLPGELQLTIVGFLVQLRRTFQVALGKRVLACFEVEPSRYAEQQRGFVAPLCLLNRMPRQTYRSCGRCLAGLLEFDRRPVLGDGARQISHGLVRQTQIFENFRICRSQLETCEQLVERRSVIGVAIT